VETIWAISFTAADSADIAVALNNRLAAEKSTIALIFLIIVISL
jgi:hypothetical protein